LSADGLAVFVSRIVEGIGCEGGDLSALFSVSLDGGRQESSFGNSLQADGGRIERSANRSKVLLANECDGILGSLKVLRESSSGVLTEVRSVSVPVLKYEDVDNLRWSSDSQSLIGIGIRNPAPGSERGTNPIRDVIRIHPDLDQVDIVVPNAKAQDAVELEGGALVVLTTDNKVKVGSRVKVFEGIGLALRPDFRAVAAYGTGGIVAVEPGRATRKLTNERAYSANWLPDGSALLYTNGAASVKVASSQSEKIELAQSAAGRYSGCSRRDSWCGGPLPYVTPDLSKLIYTAAGASGAAWEVKVVPLQIRQSPKL